MVINVTKNRLDEEYKMACKAIKQANQGLPWAVKIISDYTLHVASNGLLMMQITYLDGALKELTYNVAL